MNSESTAPADHLQRSAAQQNGLWSPPPTAALVAREARAVDWTARVDSPHGRAEIRPSTASFLQLQPSSDAHSLGLLARRYRRLRPGPGLRGDRIQLLLSINLKST
jgi:hypothetical protein